MELRKGRPADESGRLEKELRCYDFLDRIGVDYGQMERHPDRTEEERRGEEDFLEAMICKNIVLCNKKKTIFYLLVIPRDKKFVTGELCRQLGVAHLNFAQREHLEELLDVLPGSVSILGLINDREGKVKLVMDKSVTEQSHFACHPCVNTSSVRFAMEDFLAVVVPALDHPVTWVDLP